jgi:transcriptional regulator with GAF, ATPase, and Fis domain
MASAPNDNGLLEVGRLRRERDLYLRLLTLGQQNDVEAFLSHALALIVELAEAMHGYLELRDGDDRSWSTAHGMSDDEVRNIRRTISRGIIGEAMATGQTIVTSSALLDPRFSTRESVERGGIQAVICVPIGVSPTFGALYLQGRPHAFDVAPVPEYAEVFARGVAPIAQRLLSRQRRTERKDPTRVLRATLQIDDVVGRSQPLATLLQQVALVAPLDVVVLLTGESGTGKSQVARVIHDNSPRRSQPFVELNCAALPEGLVESELFGAVPGAHSMATRRMEGKIAAAEGGTLVLDEVGDLSLSAQAKLLQFLHSRDYYPLGASRPIRADVRLIGATNTDLRTAVNQRRFREDLLYRLQVLPLRVPALRERREDIPELARYFCEQACLRHSLPRVTLSAGAIHALETAAWPGNVRELAHAVQAAAIRAAGEGVEQVERTHVFPEVDGQKGEREGPATFQSATRRFQAQLLRQTLEETGWSVPETARRLDLARSYTYTLIQAFGLGRRK